MTDDHARWAVGAYGNPHIKTPTLDRIAADGSCFPNAYTPSPVCSPARASFFSGLMPSQHGVHDWLGGGDEPPGGWMAGEPLIATDLKRAGYLTGLVGKWHCGRDTERPEGFDYWLSFERGQYPHNGRQHFREIDDQGSRRVIRDGAQTPMLTDAALRFLSRRPRSQPFFLFVGYTATHSPFRDQPEGWVSHYRSHPPPDPTPAVGYRGPGWVRFGRPDDAAIRREWLVQYYAAVSSIDEQVGRLTEELRVQGELENTLVVYTSDHGHMNGHHGLYTKGNATVPQNFYEESIAVPLLVRWPGTDRPEEISMPFSHCDLHATLLDLAGAIPSSSRTLPGRSVFSQASLRSQLRFCEYGNARMVSDGRLKLVLRFPPHAPQHPDELYDLALDPEERINLIAHVAAHADVSQLRRLLDDFFRRHTDGERDGRDVIRQPRANAASEPWRLVPPRLPWPERGTEARAIENY